MFVLVCSGNGKNHGLFVSPAGSEASYTSRLQHARFYRTWAEACRNACDNEYPRNVADILR